MMSWKNAYAGAEAGGSLDNALLTAYAKGTAAAVIQHLRAFTQGTAPVAPVGVAQIQGLY